MKLVGRAAVRSCRESKMNSKFNKWKRNNTPNGQKNNPYVFDRKIPQGMVQDNFGPVAKVKKIAEKNAAKGQNSLSKFFGGGSSASGQRSNRAAFEHYAIASAAYSENMLKGANNPEEEHKDGEENVPTRKRDAKGFLKGYQH